ncbi:DUF2780 domain-containing protein [Vibrio sp. CAU 1672]|uniref:DUF2780 domain-containing protein n=1 Tax=Vibrio sp. CAU 1672 TaxID=3032594 RepID=UPI0023DCB0BF|nr:DUF2780 domain-containing protein [Vibrio sp. CAU 1672]MDF2153182.1 DUF2780 domain-containing protein [Vibrio sp. CAU 1672]
MDKRASIWLLLSLATTQSYAFLDTIVEQDEQQSLMDMVGNGLYSEPSPITELLTGQLPISTEQATTGSGALLALAQSQLSAQHSEELQSFIPGLSELGSVQSLLGNVESLQKVQAVFESVGLDPSMIGQFAPLIIGYLSEQGASDGLLTSLGGLWSGAK